MTRYESLESKGQGFVMCLDVAWYVLRQCQVLERRPGGEGSPSDANPSKDPAYNFSFTLYQGEVESGAETLNLSDLQERPMVLNFWAGLCPPCRAELPDLQRFDDEFNDQLTLIGIDIGQFTGLGSQRDAENLLSELQITFPTGFTDDPRVVSQYEVFSMPTTVFIDSKGEVFRKWSGLLNLDVLTEVATEMLKAGSGPPSSQ